jgi:hypothetical protein
VKRFLFLIVIFSSLTPLQSTITRIRSMGNLQFVINDNTNKIDLLNFGNNPCGLFANEDTSIVDLDLLYGEESSKIDTMEGDTSYYTFGNAVTYEILEFIPTYSRDFFQYIPFLTLPTNRFLYVKRNKSQKPDIWGNIPNKQAIGCKITYGKLEQTFTDGKENAGGPTITLIYDRLINKKWHIGLEGGYIHTGFSGDEENEEASLSNFKLTPGVSFTPNPSLDIGAKIDYHHPSVTFGSGENALSYSGNAFNFSLSSIAQINNHFKSGASINYKILRAKEENENFSVEGLDIRLRPRVSFVNQLFAIGGLFDYKKSKMLNESDSNDTLYKNENDRMTLGGGPILDTEYFLVGSEYIYSTYNESERYTDFDTTKTSSTTIRFGSEIRPINFLDLRGGFEYITEKEDESERKTITRNITGGFGIQLNKIVTDVCYNKIKKEEEDINKIIYDNLYIISLRYIF